MTEASSGSAPALSPVPAAPAPVATPDPTTANFQPEPTAEAVPTEAVPEPDAAEPEASRKPSAKERQNQIKSEIARLTAQKYQAQAEVAARMEQLQRLRALQAPAPVGLEYENPAQHQMHTGRAAAAAVQAEMTQSEMHRAEQQAVAAQHAMVMSRVEALSEEIPDIAATIFQKDLVITPSMAEWIASSEHGVRVAYKLGKEPQTAQRIAQMSPLMQGAELARLEAQVTAAPQRRLSTAPQPVPTLGGSRSPAVRDLASMDMAEYAEARRKQMQRT